MKLQAKALWPCCGVHGWKCSLTWKPASNPADSACSAQSSRSVGWNCSSMHAYPIFVMGLA
jgi:hypothetical protein